MPGFVFVSDEKPVDKAVLQQILVSLACKSLEFTLEFRNLTSDNLKLPIIK